MQPADRVDVQRTQGAVYRAVFRDYVRALWDVGPAPRAVATKNAICDSCKNTDPKQSDRSGARHRNRNVRVRLLGAGASSDCECSLRYCWSVAGVAVEARPSRL